MLGSVRRFVVIYSLPLIFFVLDERAKAHGECPFHYIMVLFSQDNYTFAQPGIQMKVNALKELIQRIDGKKNDFSPSKGPPLC